LLRRCLIIPLLLCAPLASAQSLRPSATLPDVPVPHLDAAIPSSGDPALPALLQFGAPQQPPQAPTPQPAAAAGEDPGLAMFPHSQTARYWISGQTNTIFQAKPGFHSPYQGPNSLDNAGEYKTSLVETLYLGYQPHPILRYNTDLLIDFESAGGRGLGEALGLAGFTNLDVVRNPNLGTAPYHRARRNSPDHRPHQRNDRVRSRSVFARHRGTGAPLRNGIGKMGVNDFFDVNDVATDSHLQFLNWTIDDNGAWDYAADTRGYTVGGLLEYDDRNWSARYGFFAMPIVANGIALDWAFSRAHGQNWEYELRHSFIHGRKGTTRILAFANTAHMGNYRLAVQDYLHRPHADARHHSVERFGTVKYGFSWNNEQDITENLPHRHALRLERRPRGILRVHRRRAVGGHFWRLRRRALASPCRQDRVAFVSNAIKKDHQNYLKYGGPRFYARRRPPQLRPRKYRRELLHLARLEGALLRPRRAAYRRSRL
jgi:high affinity Mn2+ porin